MKAKLTILIFFSMCSSALANSNFDDCYDKQESSIIQECASNKVKEISMAYSKSRKKFVAKAPSVFSENAKIIKNNEIHSNYSWGSYVRNQCKLEAILVAEKDSYGYNIKYSSCLFELYKERMAFFEKALSEH